jgi:hypothetical protein
LIFSKTKAINLDGAWDGNPKTFLANVRRFFPGANVHCIAASSDAIPPQGAARHLRDLRFFSIDGGHTRALTFNDLRLADRFLAPHGVCALDDLFNPTWPGVVSGLFAYLAEDHSLIPFAIFPNRLFLCRPAFRDDYRTELLRTFGTVLVRKDAEVGTYMTDIYEGDWLATVRSPKKGGIAVPEKEVQA